MDLDYLEDLSNKDLRKICVEHNLPNIPITDSSRKVMLRKLRASISGQPESSNKTKRRETVHNTNISNNKATTAPRTTARTADGKSPGRVTVNNINKARRTVANPSPSPSPSPVRSRISHTTTTLSSSDIGSQSEEDDSYNTYHTRREGRPELRRSVSLTKSGVLTTSYTQETKPLGATYEEIEDMDVDAQESTLTNSAFEQPHYKVYSSSQRADPITLPSYEPAFEHKIKQNLFSRPPPQLTQTQLRSSSFTGIAGLNTNINAAPINTYDGSRAPFNYEDTTKHTLNSAQSKNTFDGFKVPYNVPAAHARNISNKRRTTTGIINTGGASVAAAAGGPSLYPKLNQFYEQRTTVNSIESSSSEDEYEEEHVQPEPYETPFLSKFTRTIETAKRNTTLAAAGPKPQARRGLLHENDDNDVRESFLQLLMALQRKYHLKQAFAFIITVILGIFIYVMVW